MFTCWERNDFTTKVTKFCRVKVVKTACTVTCNSPKVIFAERNFHEFAKYNKVSHLQKLISRNICNFLTREKRNITCIN